MAPRGGGSSRGRGGASRGQKRQRSKSPEYTVDPASGSTSEEVTLPTKRSTSARSKGKKHAPTSSATADKPSSSSKSTAASSSGGTRGTTTLRTTSATLGLDEGPPPTTTTGQRDLRDLTPAVKGKFAKQAQRFCYTRADRCAHIGVLANAQASRETTAYTLDVVAALARQTERYFRGQPLDSYADQPYTSRRVQHFFDSGINGRLAAAQQRRQEQGEGSAFSRPAVIAAGESFVTDRHDERYGGTRALPNQVGGEMLRGRKPQPQQSTSEGTQASKHPTTSASRDEASTIEGKGKARQRFTVEKEMMEDEA